MAHDYVQDYYRIRSDDSIGLNTDSGWAAAENTAATIGTGKAFRIRIKLRETGTGGDSIAHMLQVKRNDGIWVMVNQDGHNVTNTAAAMLVPSTQFSDAAATTAELLTSTTTNINGEGIAPVRGPTNVITASYAPNNQELEFEWCLYINGFHDNYEQCQEGDILQFRMVESTGTEYTGYGAYPTVNVTETPYFIGGCPVETVGKVVCVDSNKNIYYITEASEVTNWPMMLKSADGGRTWREVDGVNRPARRDAEGCDFFIDGDTIHIGLQHNNEPYYHRFRMSSHSTNPDTWEITDELVEPTVTRDQQSASIVKRSDGTIVQFWQELVGSDYHMKYKIRSSGGTWGSAIDLDSTSSVDFMAAAVVLGASDKTHIFYMDSTNGDLYHKSLSSADSLSARELVYNNMGTTASNRMNFTKPVYWDDGGNEKIMVAFMDESTDIISTSIITNDGSPDTPDTAADYTVEANELGSNQIQACLSVYNDNDVYLTYARKSSPNGIWLDVNSNDGGWGTDTEVVSSVLGDLVQTHPFQHSVANGSDVVLGIIYDEGSDGGTGYVWYTEYVIVNAPFSGAASLAGSGSITATAEVIHAAAASLEPFGDLVADGLVLAISGAILAGSAEIVASGVRVRLGAVVLDGAGSVNAVGTFAYEVSATLAGVGTISGVAITVITDATAAVSGVGSLTATAAVLYGARATLAGVGTLTGDPPELLKGAAVLSGSATFVITSSSIRRSGAILAGVGSLVAIGLTPHTYNSGAILAGVGDVQPGPDVTEILPGAALLAGIGTLAAIGEKGKFGFAVLGGVGSVAPAVHVDYISGAVLVGVGGVRPVGRATPPSKAVLSGVATITGNANAALPARAILIGEVKYRPKATVTHPAQAALDGVGSIISIGIKAVDAFAVLAGVGSLVSVGDSAKRAQASLDGVGTVTGVLFVSIGGLGALSGIGGILGAPRAIFGTGAQLNGIGSFVVAPNLQKLGAMMLSGQSVLTPLAEVVHQAQAALDGAGSFSGTGIVTHPAQATLDGDSDILLFAEVVHQAQAQLDGVSTMTGSSSALAGGVSTLEGVSTLAGIAAIDHGAFVLLNGVGTMDAGGVETFGGASQLSGVGTISGLPTLQHEAESVLAGVGVLAGTGEVARGGFSVLAGVATLTADQTMILVGVVVLAGVGSVVADETVISSAPIPFSLAKKRREDTALEFRESDLELEKVK